MHDHPHILVVDDDDRLRNLLQRYLTEHGFRVSAAIDARDARSKMGMLSFDLLILDVMMPGESGLDFAMDLKKRNNIPIMMLTAMAEQNDKINGLETGVNDYLTKPFEPRELLLRIRNILKNIPTKKHRGIVKLGDIIFYTDRSELLRSGVHIHLTEVETILLSALVQKQGQVLSRKDIVEATGAVSSDRAVDVQVTRLRRKIEENPKLPRYLQTVRGRGYILHPD